MYTSGVELLGFSYTWTAHESPQDLGMSISSAFLGQHGRGMEETYSMDFPASHKPLQIIVLTIVSLGNGGPEP